MSVVNRRKRMRQKEVALKQRQHLKNKGSLKIIHISDTHGKHNRIKWHFDPANADVLVVSGDISMKGNKEEVQVFFRWLYGFPTKYKILVAGNHDLCFDPNRSGEDRVPDWVLAEIGKFTSDEGSYYLENSECEIEGIKFWGSPVTPWFHGDTWAFNKYDYSIWETWNLIPRDTDVLITHGPPRGMCDFNAFTATYIGCMNLRERVKVIKPTLHLFGHSHASHGYTYDEDTHYFNGCICDPSYSPNNKPWGITCNFATKEINWTEDEY